jgi:hypothetical protein
MRANPSAKAHFTIATKASITRNPDGHGNIFDNSATHLQSEHEGS